MPLVLALAAPGVSVARFVGLAFAVAASSFCPLLVLGIWWRRLTDAGAMAGLLAAAGSCSVAAVTDAFVGSPRPRLGRGAARPAGRVDGADRVRS